MPGTSMAFHDANRDLGRAIAYGRDTGCWITKLLHTDLCSPRRIMLTALAVLVLTSGCLALDSPMLLVVHFLHSAARTPSETQVLNNLVCVPCICMFW